MIELYICGLPVAQPRVKARSFKSKSGKMQTSVYTPGTASDWKEQIVLAVRATGIPPVWSVDGPISISIAFEFERPKSHWRTGKNAHLLRDDAPKVWHAQKADLDNLTKAVMDAISNAGGIWRDDAQVSVAVLSKRWSLISGATITIARAEE